MRSLLTLLIMISAQSFALDLQTNPLKDFTGVVVPTVGVESLPYKDVDTQKVGSLVVMGRLGNLFVEGNRLGYVLGRTQLGAISAVGQFRNHQYIPETEGLPQRDKALEAGFQLAKPLAGSWSLQVTAFTDVSDTHKGQELELGVYRRDFFGDFRLLTLFALQQQSKQLTGYYADHLDFSASADTNAELELIGVYDVTENVNVTFVYRHYYHGENLSNSPLTDGRETRKFNLGIGWTF